MGLFESVLLICVFAVIVLLAIWILSPEKGAGKETGVSIRHNGSVVTVRNAGGAEVSVTLDPEVQRKEARVPVLPGSEEEAEAEPSFLDLLRDPSTPKEKKDAVLSELEELGYVVRAKDKADGGEPTEDELERLASTEGSCGPEAGD